MGVMVSISCITYNHEKYIADAIEGFLMQKTNFEYEILIHDDASTDRTPEIIREYQKKYPDIIKPILQSENKMSKGVRRVGYRYNVTRAQGKYIAVCEGDDFWTSEHKLQKQVDFMESHPECTMCFHAAKIVKEDGKEEIGEIRLFNESKFWPKDKLFYGAGRTNATASIMYRKEYLENPPDFFFKSPVGDTPLALILSYKGRVAYIDEYMSNYRVGVPVSWNSRIHDKKDKYIETMKGILGMLDEFNQYSNYIYDEDIKRRKLEIEVAILKKEDIGKLNFLRHPKVKLYINDYSKAKKMKFYMQVMFPKLYRDLARKIKKEK